MHLIELDKIMFHEGKDRRFKGVGRASISLINLNLKNSRGPRKSPLLIADTFLLESSGSNRNCNQPVIRVNSTERLEVNCRKKSKTQSHLGDRTLKLQKGKM